MFKKLLQIALIGASLVAASAHSASFSTTEYSVTYDDSTSFGGVSGNFGGGGTLGFNWTVPLSVSVVNTTSTFDLPSFTITPTAGYSLGGAFSGSFGNIATFLLGTGTVSGTISGKVSIDGGPSQTVSFALTNTAPFLPGGYLSGSGAYTTGSQAISSFAFSDGVLSITATSTGTAAAYAVADQNLLKVSFTAAPVPEPGTYAMLLAGMFMIGSIVRRRSA